MVGTIKVIWDGPGVFKEGEKVIAGPGESLFVDHLTAEELVEHQRKAHYPRR